MSRKLTKSNLRRQQLDRSAETAIRMRDLPKFSRGYIREIRESLGLSSSQLSKRLGISQPAVIKLENSEQEGTISLNTLERVAAAMDCKLVYALVPKTSLESTLTMQAEKTARKLVRRVGHSMGLEGQATSKAEVERRVEEIKTELVRKLDRRIWEE